MNILLIDGHRLFSEGLKHTLLLQQEINEVYISNERCFSTEPYLSDIDIVICDMNEPKMNGFAIIDTLRSSFNAAVGIILLSGITDLQAVKQSIRLGANGFISKNSGIAELLEGIREVYAGKKFISDNLRVNFMNSLFIEEKMGHDLSRREQEVLQELCAGRMIKDIAAEMGLSPHTIQYYQRNIMRKLKVSRTVDLIVYAVRNGLYAMASDN